MEVLLHGAVRPAHVLLQRPGGLLREQGGQPARPDLPGQLRGGQRLYQAEVSKLQNFSLN